MNENAGKTWTKAQDVHLASMYNGAHNKGVRFRLLDVAANMGRSDYALTCRLEHLDARGLLLPKTQQSIKKETKMKNTTVTKRTYVGDVDASTLTTEDLLAIIEQEEKLMDRLNSLKNKTLKVKELLVKHRSNINALVELIG